MLHKDFKTVHDLEHEAIDRGVHVPNEGHLIFRVFDFLKISGQIVVFHRNRERKSALYLLFRATARIGIFELVKVLRSLDHLVVTLGEGGHAFSLSEDLALKFDFEGLDPCGAIRVVADDLHVDGVALVVLVSVENDVGDRGGATKTHEAADLGGESLSEGVNDGHLDLGAVDYDLFHSSEDADGLFGIDEVLSVQRHNLRPHSIPQLKV